MTGTIRFTKAAESDVEDAAAWYADQREELSVGFLEAVNEVVERIARNPAAFPVRIGRASQANLKRPWPYTLWFVMEGDAIVIAALHGRRDLSTVRRRLES